MQFPSRPPFYAVDWSHFKNDFNESFIFSLEVEEVEEVEEEKSVKVNLRGTQAWWWLYINFHVPKTVSHLGDTLKVNCVVYKSV